MKLPKLGGQGVLLPGGVILTATHCIEVITTGAMALASDDFVEPIATKTHGALMTTPIMAETVADVAALGNVDGQILYDESEAFERFCEETAPVELHSGKFDPAESQITTGGLRLFPYKAFEVFVLDCDGLWIPGTATPSGWIGSGKAAPWVIEVNWSAPIKSGASGGPIVTSSGELIGVMSYSAWIFVLSACLPSRILNQISTSLYRSSAIVSSPGAK